jgi:hypothetical protein
MTPQQVFVPRMLTLSIVVSTGIFAWLALTEANIVSLDAFDFRKISPQSGPEVAWLFVSMLGIAASFVVPMGLARNAKAKAAERPPAARAFPGFVLGLAFAELCAIVGFVSFTIGQAPAERAVMLAAVAAAVILLFHFPTEKRLLRLAGEAREST